MAVPSGVKCYCSTDKPTIVWTGALGQCSRCSLRLVETVVVPHPDRPGEVPHLGSQVVLAMVPSHFPKDTSRRGSPSKTGKSWPPSACWAGQAGKPSWENGEVLVGVVQRRRRDSLPHVQPLRHGVSVPWANERTNGGHCPQGLGCHEGMQRKSTAVSNLGHGLVRTEPRP